MDRAIKKKKFTPKRIVLVFVACAIIFFLTHQVLSRSGTTRLKVDPSRMTISKTVYGEFLEYYPFDGEVVPEKTVYVDVETGGRVVEIFAEDGEYINKGDPILLFSNDNTRRNSIQTENDLLISLDELSNRKLTIAQDELNNEEALLTLDYEITKKEKKYKRYKALMAENLISQEEFETVEDELNYMKAQRNIRKERIQKEKILNEKQLEQVDFSIRSANQSLELLRESIESLEEKARISGKLSGFDVEIGQQIGSGTRIGRIDVLDKLKIKAEIDQYYYSKVSVGTKGEFTLDGETYGGVVTKKYGIEDEVFKADIDFVGDAPEVTIGRTLSINLYFSEAEKSLMVKKGGFYQETGGRWAYLISEDRKTAHRVNIRLNRHNPKFLEILEGLNEGDWIITSGYETYNEADELIFPEPLILSDSD